MSVLVLVGVCFRMIVFFVINKGRYSIVMVVICLGFVKLRKLVNVRIVIVWMVYIVISGFLYKVVMM